MSTNSSSLKQYKELSEVILKELDVIAVEFLNFQNQTAGLSCPAGCGKCCFKKDIHCAPIELLPMALTLLERGLAEKFYEDSFKDIGERCMFLYIADAEKFQGHCTEYATRPLVCRTFGAGGIHDKAGKVNFFACRVLKETYAQKFAELFTRKFNEGEIPFIDQSKAKISNLDPRFLEEEHPIHVSLRIMLEKVLLLSQLHQ